MKFGNPAGSERNTDDGSAASSSNASAESNSGGAQLQMDSGSRWVKPAIIGGLAIAFAGGVFAMTHGSDSKIAKAAPGASDSSVLAEGNAPAAGGDATASNDQSGAPAAAADNTAAKTDTAANDAAAAPAANAPAAAADSSNAVASGAAASDASTSTATPPDTTTAPKPAAAADSAPQVAAAAAPAPAAPKASKAKADASTTGSDVAMNTTPAASDSTAPASSGDTAAAAPKKDEHANRKAVRPETAAASDALRPWWAPTTEQHFGVQFVGQAADQQTLVIRFTRQVSDPAAQENIKIVAENGQPVAANFQPGQDPRVLIVPNMEPGRYTVMIDPKLASVNNETLGTELHGPAFIEKTPAAATADASPTTDNTQVASSN